jgi:hypothetical protein
MENQRRITEEKMRKERANKIQTEVITSHKKNVEIDWTWQELEEKEDCEELANVSYNFSIFIIKIRISKFRRMLVSKLLLKKMNLSKPSWNNFHQRMKNMLRPLKSKMTILMN